jgi:hypothetical protein
VAESRKLADQIGRSEASQLPNLAFLVKGHLDKAIELNPVFDEAHFSLALWYLQSPELAAKSQDKVQEILATLERMKSPLAEVLRKRLVVTSATGGRVFP